MRERRRERRHKVLKEGKIMLSDWASVSCVVRDISASGARLEFEGPVHLPSAFHLCIVSADLKIPAVLAWQQQNEAGVRFTGVGAAGNVESAALSRSAAA